LAKQTKTKEATWNRWLHWTKCSNLCGQHRNDDISIHKMQYILFS